MQNKKRNWPYSGHRWKRWSEKKGVRVATFLEPNSLLGVKQLAKKYHKEEWKILRAAVGCGITNAWKRAA